jgi:hypothetical protein
MKKLKRTPKILSLSRETIAHLTSGDGLIQLPPSFPIVTGSTLEVCLTTSLDTTVSL